MTSPGHSSKITGNQAFKAGDYPAAIGHYTTAILADPNDLTYPLNRAAAYLKLGKYEDAERDCSTVLRLDSENVKAWFRRGRSRLELGLLEEAQRDFQRAIQLDAQNCAVDAELRKVRDLLTQKEEGKSAERGIPPSFIPSPKRRRVPIVIVDPGTSTQSFTLSSVFPGAQGHATSSALPLLHDRDSNHPRKLAAPQEAKTARITTLELTGGGIFRSNGDHTIFDPKSTSYTATDQQPGILDSAFSKIVTPSPKISSLSRTKSIAQSAQSLRVTLFAFSREWYSRRTVIERWNLLLENVPPAAVASLFKNSLETSVLVSLLETFRELLLCSTLSNTVRPWVREYLVQLTRVPRFSTIVLFMTSDERALVKAVWAKTLDDDDSADPVIEQAKSAWRTE